MRAGAENAAGKPPPEPDSPSRRRAAARGREFKGADKWIIVGLTFFLFLLFIWLIRDPERGFYTYLFTLTLLTVIFVGLLGASGAWEDRSSGYVLKGSAAVFAILLAVTSYWYGKHYDAIIKKLKDSNYALQAQMDSAMHYEERTLTGTVRLINGAQVSKELLKFTMHPGKDDISGPYQGRGDGEAFGATIEIPVKRSQGGKEEHVFSKLAVRYPGYHEGCIILDESISDPNCASLSPDGGIEISLTPAAGSGGAGRELVADEGAQNDQ